jgi:urate oxidase
MMNRRSADLTAEVCDQSYGKSRVRLSRITRTPQRHEFQELAVDLSLSGDFAAAYTVGDNRAVIPTDTMKNTVYAVAHEHGVASLESFACRLARHFLDAYPHVDGVVARLEERPWARMQVGGKEHPHSFIRAGSEVGCCQVHASRVATRMQSGLAGLEVLKTTGSGFTGFFKDAYTTLPETEDRVLATTLEAWWPCADLEADWAGARQSIRAAMLKVFAEQYSPSVQATLFQMAAAALECCRLIDEISMTMPNQHHLPANLAPLGMKNDNATFVPTEEPFGLIRATVKRRPGGAAP